MPKKATFHIADPSMLGSRLFDRIEGIESYEGISDGSTATGLRFGLQWGSVTMNFMAADKIADHLNGLSGWVQQTMKGSDALVYTLARVHHVRMVIGCVIEHDDSATDDAFSFLLHFNIALNGLLFVCDSLLDFTGDALAGPMVAEMNSQ